MNTPTVQTHIQRLLEDCRSELLDHVLQDKVASQHIKRIKSNLDECLNTLQGSWQEALPARHTARKRSARTSGEARKNILFFAYSMSKYDYPFVNSITGNNFNQSEALSYLADKLKVNVHTLRNYRDSFDSHVDQQQGNRQGWKQPLTPELEAIKQQYEPFDERELIEKGKAILRATAHEMSSQNDCN
ncbi:hypothetical protein [Candidatus Spongiihabitans sp.]|uniref:hypothetical protein n=1 Tax=Candidatus Spongiihabitans sp. TaxID=3101308 RepID=UPI003C7054AA